MRTFLLVCRRACMRARAHACTCVLTRLGFKVGVMPLYMFETTGFTSALLVTSTNSNAKPGKLTEDIARFYLSPE